MWGYWVFFVLESILIHFALPAGELALAEGAYVGLILINSLILLLVLGFRYRHDSNFAVLIIGGFLMRLFFLFWSEYYSHIFTLPNSGADEFTYYYNAMSALVKDAEFTGYALLFSWQARLFGLSKVFGKFVNVLLSVSAILILRRILRRLDMDGNTRVKTLAFACFLPNFGIMSALLLRESAIAFLVAVSAYFLLRWWQSGSLGSLLLSLLASVAAAWLHSGMVAYTLGILCVAVSTRRASEGASFRFLSIRTLVLSAVTATLMLALLMNLDLGITSYFRGAESLEDIVSISDAYEDGGSAYNANIVSNAGTLGFIINTPFRMFYFLFAPVPWNWRSAADAIAFCFSAVFYGYVFFKAMAVTLRSRRFSLGSAFFLVSLLVLMIFGWGVSNSGTALRHRDKMVIHYLIMYALLQQNAAAHSERYVSRSHSDEIQHHHSGL